MGWQDAPVVGGGWESAPVVDDEPKKKKLPPVMQGLVNVGAGAIRGAGSIGATLMRPFESAEENAARRKDMDSALAQLVGAETGSLAYQGGKVGAEVAGTLGAGGVLAKGAQALKAAPQIVTALQTGGMSTGGGLSRAADLATRTLAGGTVGGISAGMVNPEDAGLGAAIGGALPGVSQAAGYAGRAVGSAARGMIPQASPDVVALAGRAKELGIDIPADRLVNSRPLDAVASGLNYVPFSGRAATETRMATQLNQAASRLMGQDTPNINLALRKAGEKLGSEFDTALKSTGVALDKQMLDDVASVFNTAQKELGSDALKPIAAQVDELISKGASGTIDGQAAYNIKRTLDRLGKQNTPTAFHALELKRVLMDALNRSMGTEKAAAFATTRQQYGNMLALEKLAKNGVEGEISVARLANLGNINNQPLQELADIAAQFVKAREGQHGAMQRAVVGLGTAATAGPAGLMAGAGVGRSLNTLLESQAMRRAVTGQPMLTGADPELARLLGRAAPAIAAD